MLATWGNLRTEAPLSGLGRQPACLAAGVLHLTTRCCLAGLAVKAAGPAWQLEPEAVPTLKARGNPAPAALAVPNWAWLGLAWGFKMYAWRHHRAPAVQAPTKVHGAATGSLTAAWNHPGSRSWGRSGLATSVALAVASESCVAGYFCGIAWRWPWVASGSRRKYVALCTIWPIKTRL